LQGWLAWQIAKPENYAEKQFMLAAWQKKRLVATLLRELAATFLRHDGGCGILSNFAPINGL
jgi:hypothetical protein